MDNAYHGLELPLVVRSSTSGILQTRSPDPAALPNSRGLCDIILEFESRCSRACAISSIAVLVYTRPASQLQQLLQGRLKITTKGLLYQLYSSLTYVACAQ